MHPKTCFLHFPVIMVQTSPQTLVLKTRSELNNGGMLRNTITQYIIMDKDLSFQLQKYEYVYCR